MSKTNFVTSVTSATSGEVLLRFFSQEVFVIELYGVIDERGDVRCTVPQSTYTQSLAQQQQ
jgi:hypothetical protein